MTTYQQIEAAITAGKALAITWASNFINNDSYGEKNGCGPLQLVVLVDWIEILDDYATENFDADGNAVTPSFDCLTFDQAMLLVAKINNLTC